MTTQPSPLALFAVVLALFAAALAGCGSTAPATCPADAQVQCYPSPPALVGTWRITDGPGQSWSLTFVPDGAFAWSDGTQVVGGSWSVSGQTLTITLPGWGQPLVDTWSVSGSTLTLVGWFEGDWTRVAS